MNYLPQTKKRIAVAMSGGVDSSVVAWQMAKAGHEVIGLTAWTLNGPGKCCNDALVNAGRVCEMLGVEYDTVDLRAEFSHFVMDYYNNSYRAGLTPNPCVECNRHVKWELLVRYAVEELGVDYVATGHYAQIAHFDPQGRLTDQHTETSARIFRSRDEHKDQTYMMTRVYPRDLSRALFPLGDMTKPDVVRYAKEVELPTAHSKESQDICFVLNGQDNYMNMTFGVNKGPIVDIDTGKTIGEHDGYYRFTLGQRKGLKVAAGRPVYVVKIDAPTNTVYLGDAHHLETSSFTVLAPNWLNPVFEEREAFESMVKIRYNSQPTLGRVEKHGVNEHGEGLLKVTLNAPVSAITPGQIAAFYDEDFNELWGGGYIEQHLIHRDMQDADWNAVKENLPDLHCQLV